MTLRQVLHTMPRAALARRVWLPVLLTFTAAWFLDRIIAGLVVHFALIG